MPRPRRTDCGDLANRLQRVLRRTAPRRQESLYHAALSQADLKAELLVRVGLGEVPRRPIRPVRRPRDRVWSHPGDSPTTEHESSSLQ